MPITRRFEREPIQLDRGQLLANLGEADPAIMVLCAVHATGDSSLLDRFGGAIHRSIPSGPAATLPVVTMDDHLRSELKEVLADALCTKPVTPHLVVDDQQAFLAMASLAVGEPVAGEFASLLLEQSGFVPTQPVVPRTRRPSPAHRIAVLGAGMAGIAAGVYADQNGFDYEIFERSNDIGGTWRTNTYPGVAVDTPSLYYSYSFDLNAQWSRYFPIGTEYQEYLRRVVDAFDIKSHIRFETEVTGLQWIEVDQEWEVTSTDSGGTQIKSRFSAVITAFGYLNRPKFADVPGRESFGGTTVHTADWPEDLDVTGKRVAVIGAGATSVQVVGAIGGQVQEMSFFQRQPHWVMPKNAGSPDVPEGERWLLAHLPFYNQWFRLKTYWGASDNMYDVVRAEPEWMKDHLSISPANDAVMQYCLNHIAKSFADRPDLVKAMTPDYAPAGKRLVRDPGNFYSTLKKPNVEVVTERIERIVPEGIVTADGRTHELDVIVHATGFTLDYLAPIDIVGREGRTLNEVWKGDDPFAYLGGTVPGFPNLFVTSGPNTSPGHGGGHNFTVEAVLHYIFECLQLMVENDASAIEVTTEATEAYNQRVTDQLENSVWTTQTGANTYYRNKAGRVTLPSPWRMVDFWTMLRAPDAASFTVR
ncbi:MULTISPECIES: flavin-containing monooxygenase [unclassified Rhodococcus (in: high G+C Gram-positive bacteria)]|uniref:flavin-containing monooxygenase n=1 Tax=unclassified Rhodococcus (in: high G+C Gram-positive bacteria) TaxID=192944 RepID=UPI0015C64154|nr:MULTISPECIES: NAD(P)/FAD-dependent oxidoreductase [unclassified Rhodococcus (in: high G+C Gram-positive bacteria)]